MKKHLFNFKVLQVLVDAVLILLVFVLTYFIEIKLNSSQIQFSEYFLMACLTMPFTLWIMFFARSYTLNQDILDLRHVQRIAFLAIQNAALFTIFYAFFYHYSDFSRVLLFSLVVLTSGFLYFWHVIFLYLLRNQFKKGKGVFNTLIIGANRPAENIIKTLLQQGSHIWPKAIIDAYGTRRKEIEGVPIVGKMNQFEQIIREYEVDVILQTDHLEQSLNVINFALANNIGYLMPPELLGVFQGHQIVEQIGGLPFLKVNPQKSWWHVFW